MSNMTEPNAPNDGTQFIWLYIVWIIFFFTTALPNLFASLAILRHQALRFLKEYHVIGALCLADALNITFYSCAGIHRLGLIASGQWSSSRSPWSCVILPHNILDWFTGPCHSLMLIVISLDRLMSVSLPLKYLSFDRSFAYCMIVPVYTFSLGMMLSALVFGFLKRNEPLGLLPMACFTGPTALTLNKYWAAIFFYESPVCGAVSIAIYGLVLIIYRMRMHSQVAPAAGPTEAERKRQKVLTVNLAWSSFWTTILVVIPIVLASTGDMFGLPRAVLQPLWLLPPINAFANVVIFYKRQPELKIGVKALFTNKTMPPTLNLWNA